MRILAVSDQESPFYYDHYAPGRLSGLDLILSCGDLSRDYLEFLGTLAGCPVVYVRGNHDDSYALHPPEGCLCIEDQIFTYKGLRILGLGGSLRYRDGRNMYTETQMSLRILRMTGKLHFSRGFDILVTHAPARGINDLDTPSHRGFQCFTSLLDKYQPRLFLHGHIHKNYGRNIPERSLYRGTCVINASGCAVIDL